MKENVKVTMKKITDVILWIFGIGITACLIAGALSLVGFLVALCIGGETATEICVFIHKTYFPWVIRFTTIFAFFGLIGMYMSKAKALTVSNDTKDNEEKEESEDNKFEENNAEGK